MSTDTTTTTVQQIDPSTLLVDVNVRHDARLTTDFIDSLRDLGVLQPVVAVRTLDGQVRVRLGHRRTLGAIEAGLATVPVVVAADEADDDDATVKRLVGQWAENEHRVGLTRSERIGVMGQLSAFGMSPSQIAKRTRTDRAEVDTALALSAHAATAATVDAHEALTLDQVAVLVEFDGDDEAREALLKAAPVGKFEHVAQRLRDAQAEARTRADLEAQAGEDGTTVVPEPAWDSDVTALKDLVDAERQVLTADTHNGCPGHVAFITEAWAYLDPTTGQPVREDDETKCAEQDEDGEQDENEDEQEGDEEATTSIWAPYLTIAHGCTDPAANGHKSRYSVRGESGRIKAADMTPEQREAATAERRDVLRSNREWKSAETVRRDWLRTFLTRKTAPKGTASFIAKALAEHADTVARTEGSHLAADLLARAAAPAYGRSRAVPDLLAKASEPRAQVIGLALVLSAYEAATHVGSWRNVDAGTARHLTFLEANGYTLSDVEARACGRDPLPEAEAPEDVTEDVSEDVAEEQEQAA